MMPFWQVLFGDGTSLSVESIRSRVAEGRTQASTYGGSNDECSCFGGGRFLY